MTINHLSSKRALSIIFIGLLSALLLALFFVSAPLAAEPATGSISGTTIYYGIHSGSPKILVAAHETIGAPPVKSVSVSLPGGAYALNDLTDGGYYISAFLDLGGDGGPPEEWEPQAWYDGNVDGDPDLVTISGGNLTGMDIAVADGLVYVDAAATGDNDGTSWADAYTDLFTAISSTPSYNDIWIAAGTYTPGATRNTSFILKNWTRMYGGFQGNELLRSQRDWQRHVTILSGDIGATGVYTDNSYHVVTGSSVNGTAVLDGVTITGGYANVDNGQDDKGGGLKLYNGSPYITNVNFIDNYALYHGGAVVATGANSGFYFNCTFSGNAAGANGGAMANLDSTGSTLENVTMTGNTGSNGGGVVNLGSAGVWIRNSILWGNQGAEIGLQGSSWSYVRYSLIDGATPYTGEGNIIGDPLFVDADGADDTIGTLDDDLRLLAGSPAFDAGNNDMVRQDYVDMDGDGNKSEITPVDMNGNRRFANNAAADTGIGPAPIVDLGAFEQGNWSFVPIVITK